MEDKKPYLCLNAFLAKDEHASLQAEEYIKELSQVRAYELNGGHGLEGKLFVKIPAEKKPKWGGFAETVSGASLDELSKETLIFPATSKAIPALVPCCDNRASA